MAASVSGDLFFKGSISQNSNLSIAAGDPRSESSKGLPQNIGGDWISLVDYDNRPQARFVTGKVYRNKIFGGTHNRGGLYSYDINSGQFSEEMNGVSDRQGWEAVLDLIVHKDSLYSINEMRPSEVRRLDSQTGSWVICNAPELEYYMFTTLFNERLYLTGGSRSKIDLLRTDDGHYFYKVFSSHDWVWRPVVYKNELYLLGHGGSAYDKQGAKAYKSKDGISFEEETGLAGGPEYQCAFQWRDYLYLGTGGWTNNRASRSDAPRLRRPPVGGRPESRTDQRGGAPVA